MAKKTLTIAIVFCILATALAVVPLMATAAPECPWRISQIAVGKWANGKAKAGVWIRGSFPTNIPGITERPDWKVNGRAVGKSQIHFQNRFLPNSSSRLGAGSNTVQVEFSKPPLSGAFDRCVIQGFNWKDVPNGGYKWYGCR